MPVSVSDSVPAKRAAWALIAVLAFAACGRQAPPLPPLVRVAERTTDLQAFQKGGEAVLRWSYPSMTTTGENLPDVEAVEVWRAELPLAQEPGPALSREDRAMRRQLLESQGEVLMVLVPDALSEATRGPSIVFRDDLEAWRQSAGEAADSIVLWYGVRTICCRGRESELSNVVRLQPEEPPPPPTGLRLIARAEGIDLEWQQATGLKTLVERSRDGTAWAEVSGEPIGGRDWRDTTAAQGQSFNYRLRSVRELPGGGRVVGLPSPPRRIDHPDTYPPGSPAGVVCLPEGARVRIRWQAVEGAAAYTIRRGEVGGDLEVLADRVEAVEFTDLDPPLGELRYEVSALDSVGNSSRPSSCTVIMGALP